MGVSSVQCIDIAIARQITSKFYAPQYRDFNVHLGTYGTSGNTMDPTTNEHTKSHKSCAYALIYSWVSMGRNWAGHQTLRGRGIRDQVPRNSFLSLLHCHCDCHRVMCSIGYNNGSSDQLCDRVNSSSSFVDQWGKSYNGTLLLVRAGGACTNGFKALQAQALGAVGMLLMPSSQFGGQSSSSGRELVGIPVNHRTSMRLPLHCAFVRYHRSYQLVGIWRRISLQLSTRTQSTTATP